MPRDFTDAFRSSLEAPQTGEVFLTFATLTHDDLDEPIRVVNDVVDYIYEGETFTGFPFELELLTDQEGPPRGRISIQNVDRQIGQAIQDLTSSPRLKLEVLARSDFDDQNPREVISSPASVEYSADFLRLMNVSVDAMIVSADIGSWDFTSEPWPKVRATMSRLPGLFLR